MAEKSYQEIYETAISGLKEESSKQGTFDSKKWILPAEDILDEKLGELEENLFLDVSKKYAGRTLMHIRDGLKYNYWSDISKEAWDLMAENMIILQTPEHVTREIYREFSAKLLDLGVHPLPNTNKMEERYPLPEEYKNKGRYE